jgi:hypothetical protein
MMKHFFCKIFKKAINFQGWTLKIVILIQNLYMDFKNGSIIDIMIVSDSI